MFDFEFEYCTLGAALIHLCEAHFFGSMAPPGEYKERLAPVLRRAHRDFLLWKKLHRKQCSQPKFTPARLNRTLGMSFSVDIFFCLRAPVEYSDYHVANG